MEKSLMLFDFNAFPSMNTEQIKIANRIEGLKQQLVLLYGTAEANKIYKEVYYNACKSTFENHKYIISSLDNYIRCGSYEKPSLYSDMKIVKQLCANRTQGFKMTMWYVFRPHKLRKLILCVRIGQSFESAFKTAKMYKMRNYANKH